MKIKRVKNKAAISLTRIVQADKSLSIVHIKQNVRKNKSH